MAHHVESMDVDDIDSDFDNKENTYHHSNMLPRTPCTEKGYEELDVSELNMKLRYSFTPVSSPMSKSYTANCLDNKTSDSFDDPLHNNITENGNLTRSFNSTMTKSPKVLPLQVLASDQFLDNNRNASVLRQLDSTITEDNNNITLKITGPHNDENLSLPSSSSSTVHTPEVTTPTKEIPRQDGGSPIMRGLKSVFNMFRPSQSPIPPADDDKRAAEHNILSPPDIASPQVDKINEPKIVLASTPIAAHKNKELNLSKRNSPQKDSIVFNNDLEKELQWKDETTIIFSKEKIPIHKLFPQHSKPILEPKTSQKISNSATVTQNANVSLNTSVEYMDISYNDSVILDRTMKELPTGENLNKTDTNIGVESDSEFLDCETTFTKNDSQTIKDKTLESDHTFLKSKVEESNIETNIAENVESLKLETTKESLDSTVSIKSADLSLEDKMQSAEVNVSTTQNVPAHQVADHLSDIVHKSIEAQQKPEDATSNKLNDRLSVRNEENIIEHQTCVAAKELCELIERNAEPPALKAQIALNKTVDMMSVEIAQADSSKENFDTTKILQNMSTDFDNGNSQSVSTLLELTSNFIANEKFNISKQLETNNTFVKFNTNDAIDNTEEVNSILQIAQLPVNDCTISKVCDDSTPCDIPLPDDDFEKDGHTSTKELTQKYECIPHEIPPIHLIEINVQLENEEQNDVTQTKAACKIPLENIENYDERILPEVEQAETTNELTPKTIVPDDVIKIERSVDINTSQTTIDVQNILVPDNNVTNKNEEIIPEIEATHINESLPHEQMLVNKSQEQILPKSDNAQNIDKDIPVTEIAFEALDVETNTSETIIENKQKVNDSIKYVQEDKDKIPRKEIIPNQTQNMLNLENVVENMNNNLPVSQIANILVEAKTQNVLSAKILENNHEVPLVQTVVESNAKLLESLDEITITNDMISKNIDRKDTHDDKKPSDNIEVKSDIPDIVEPKIADNYMSTTSTKDCTMEVVNVTKNDLIENELVSTVSANVPPDTITEKEIIENIEINKIDNTDILQEKVKAEQSLDVESNQKIDNNEDKLENDDEELIVSENNSPYISLASDLNVVSEGKPMENFEEIENPFATKTKVKMSPPSSPKIVSKGYNFNFDEIDDPFATKTKIRMSPPPGASPNKSFELIPNKKTIEKRSEPLKKDINKNRRKSQPERKKLNTTKKNFNSTFDSTQGIPVQTSTKETEIEPPNSIVDIKVDEIQVNQTSDLNANQTPISESLPVLVQDNAINTKISEISKKVEEDILNKDGNKETQNVEFEIKPENSEHSVETVSEVTKEIKSTSDLSAYYSAGTSSNENVAPKNVFNLPEIDTSTYPFTTRSKLCQSPPPMSENNDDKTNISPDSLIINQSEVKGKEITIENNAENKQSTELEKKDKQVNISNTTNSSKTTDEKDVTICEVHTEDEDTVEGPFLDTDDLNNIDKMSDFDGERVDMMQLNNLPAKENDENVESGEMFIDAEAFDFLMNQNKCNEVADSGKESLFLKFDPLFARRVTAEGVVAALNKVQKGQSSPKKSLRSPQKDIISFEKSSVAGSSNMNTSRDYNVPDESSDDLNLTVSKPMMVVTPAVNPVVTPRNKSITPTRTNRRSMTFTSPAIAVIDRLLSLSGNNSPASHEITVQQYKEQREADLALTQLRELLAEKELHVHHLRTESKELKDRLTTLESQMRSLEVESQARLKKINDLNERLADKTKINKSMAAVVEEYERTIASLITETEQDKKRHAEERNRLIKERDEQTAHLASMEVSFTDLHSKYEKSKQVILGYKANEDIYKKSIKEFEDNLVKMQTNYDLLKQHATSKLNHANQELEKMNRTHEAEVVKLNAMIKRKELHITSLEESLTQKIKANEELTAICDELINKVG